MAFRVGLRMIGGVSRRRTFLIPHHRLRGIPEGATDRHHRLTNLHWKRPCAAYPICDTSAVPWIWHPPVSSACTLIVTTSVEPSVQMN